MNVFNSMGFLKKLSFPQISTGLRDDFLFQSFDLTAFSICLCLIEEVKDRLYSHSI